MTKLKQLIKQLFAKQVTQEDYEPFLTQLNINNIIKVRYVTVAFIIMEIIMLALHLNIKHDTLFVFPDLLYGIMYVLMLSFMFVMRFAFEKWSHQDPLPLTKIRAFGVVFSLFILLWSATISLLDLTDGGEAMVYVVGLIGVGTVPFYKPLTSLVMYVTAHLYYLLVFIFFITPTGHAFANIVNPSLFVILSWSISVIRYHHQEKDFVDQKIIQSQSQEMKKVIEESAVVNAKLTRLSQTDALTGCYNFYMFQEKIKEAWWECLISQEPLSLLMIDIDNFKTLNDRYGHQAGDICLQCVGGVLNSASEHPGCSVARYGGDEFAIILKKTTQKEAIRIVERIRKDVEKLEVPECPFPFPSFKITISIGINTIIPTEADTIEHFIRETDIALYQAKALRNKYITA